ncbi:hypothetical protein BH09PLA1_BH09PLA1_21020 [soil metagenome]
MTRDQEDFLNGQTGQQIGAANSGSYAGDVTMQIERASMRALEQLLSVLDHFDNRLRLDHHLVLVE